MPVTVVVLGMLLCVAAAVAVLALVAVPRVREGDRLLTADGEAAVRHARRRARALAGDAKAMADDVRARRSESRARQDEAPPEAQPAPHPPCLSADERRAASARERIARSLEWGDPEPGPRHRR
jgi:hypothetical protein